MNRTTRYSYLLSPQRNNDEVAKPHLQKGKGRVANVAEWSVSLVMSSLSRFKKKLFIYFYTGLVLAV